MSMSEEELNKRIEDLQDAGMYMAAKSLRRELSQRRRTEAA